MSETHPSSTVNYSLTFREQEKAINEWIKTQEVENQKLRRELAKTDISMICDIAPRRLIDAQGSAKLIDDDEKFNIRQIVEIRMLEICNWEIPILQICN